MDYIVKSRSCPEKQTQYFYAWVRGRPRFRRDIQHAMKFKKLDMAIEAVNKINAMRESGALKDETEYEIDDFPSGMSSPFFLLCHR